MPSITKDDLMQFMPEMDMSINRGHQFGVETGFTICEHPDGEYSTAGECTGDACSLVMDTCRPPNKNAATFHTHPIVRGAPSASDKMYEAVAKLVGYPERALRPDLIPSAMDTIFGIIADIDALCIGNMAGVVCYPSKDPEDMPEEARMVYDGVTTALLRCNIALETGDKETLDECNVDLNYIVQRLGVPIKDWFYDEEFWLR